MAFWAKYFNLNAFETRNRRFVGTATTDGVAISMLLDRPSSPSGPRVATEGGAPRLESLADGTVVVAVDPGFTDVVTLARRTVATRADGTRALEGGDGTASYSSARYYEVARIDASRRVIDRWNEETAEAVRRLVSPRTLDPERSEAAARSFLAELPGLLAHRTARAYRNLRFTRHVHRQKAIDDVCSFVASPSEGRRVVVAMGDWTGGHQSPVSRKRAGPLADVRRRLANTPGVTLLSVDEFRTSVTCSKCFGRLVNMRARSRVRVRGRALEWRETYGKVHKVLHCMNSDGALGCRGAWTWNRDANAARNILMLAERAMRGLPRPDPFTRSTRCPGP